MPAVDLQADRAQALALVSVSRETELRIELFAQLLFLWNEKISLIGPSTAAKVWTRHIADSLQLLPLVPGAETWLDVGSGAGFPGMVIACALAGRPGTIVHLVESNARKATFLREAIRLTKVRAQVHNLRIEQLNIHSSVNGKIDVVTARAVAPLTRLLDYAEPYLARGARGLFPKGQNVEHELAEASTGWNIDAELIPSLTDEQGRIVLVRQAQRIRRPGSANRVDVGTS